MPSVCQHCYRARSVSHITSGVAPVLDIGESSEGGRCHGRGAGIRELIWLSRVGTTIASKKRRTLREVLVHSKRRPRDALRPLKRCSGRRESRACAQKTSHPSLSLVVRENDVPCWFPSDKAVRRAGKKGKSRLCRVLRLVADTRGRLFRSNSSADHRTIRALLKALLESRQEMKISCRRSLMPDAFIYDHVRPPRGRGKPDGALHELTAVPSIRPA